MRITLALLHWILTAFQNAAGVLTCGSESTCFADAQGQGAAVGGFFSHCYHGLATNLS